MNGKINNNLQVGYVRRYTLTDGKESGLKVIEIDTGKIRFLLNESKNLDIMQLWHQGVNMSFVSKNGFTSREIPFVERFEGGMLYTCGLDAAGTVEGHTQHGNLHQIPARVTECKVENDEIKVVGEMQDSALFGKNLLLRRTVKAKIGESTLRLTDELFNLGTKNEDYALLYHVNVGYPMLDKGTTMYSDAKKVVAYDEWAQKRIENRTVFTDCVDNEDECCYFLYNETPIFTVTNEKLGKTLTLSYTNETLPYCVQWNSTASGDYALGLEPSTTLLGKKDFAYSVIGVGESKKFGIEISVE